MKPLKSMIALASLFSLAACSQANTDKTQGEILEAQPAHLYASWEGRWIGVEGMFVEITPTQFGRYELEMQSDLDTLGTYEGEDTAQGIQFMRGGEYYTLQQGTGDETALKYLFGKTNCLIVKAGEGYCRD